MDWVKLCRLELLSTWTLARQRKPLPRIEPLKRIACFREFRVEDEMNTIVWRRRRRLTRRF
jgi:hypothetical protein